MGEAGIYSGFLFFLEFYYFTRYGIVKTAHYHDDVLSGGDINHQL
jgi:hypothetical protein